MATGNMKDIKRRIKSVSSTMQITKAMELVASSKLRKAKMHAEQMRPYFETQYELLCEIAAENVDSPNVYTAHLKPSEVKSTLYIVIAGDRGLAGGYNSNVLKLASGYAAENGFAEGVKPKIIAVGKKAVEYFEKRDFELVGKYPGIAENIKVSQCSDIASTAVNMFKSGEVDNVVVFFTTYVSPLVQTASSLAVLPLDSGSSAPTYGADYRATSYDPSPEAVFARIIPKYLLSIVHCCIVESYASEQCARRVAMENASDNAEQMIENLSLLYNRARQEKITNEINEIVSGANAL